MPGSAGIQLERRYINDEIEQAYIATSQHSSELRLKINFEKGNYLASYKEFYKSFSYLITLTSPLKELNTFNDTTEDGKKQKSVLLRAAKYQNTEVPIKEGSDAQLKQVCKEGMALFDDYKAQLFRVGIIALPTRKGG